METISRRNFLTLGAMGAAGAAVCGLVGCAPQSAEKSGSGVAAGNGETINCYRCYCRLYGSSYL